jgi:hypothetical protein
MKFLRDFLLEPAPAPRRARDATPPHAPAPRRDVGFEPPVAARMPAARAGAHSGVAAAAAAPEVAVLAPPGRVAALGAAAALLLARRRRAATGLIIVWAPGLAPLSAGSAAASRAARRLVAVLDGRGLEARAAGRLATVILPDDPVHAAAAGARAVVASQGSPVVLALGGRAAPFDALLSAQDRVLVVLPADAEPPLTELALGGLRDVARDVRICTATPTAAARALLATGLAVPASVRHSLWPALDGLGP